MGAAMTYMTSKTAKSLRERKFWEMDSAQTHTFQPHLMFVGKVHRAEGCLDVGSFHSTGEDYPFNFGIARPNYRNALFFIDSRGIFGEDLLSLPIPGSPVPKSLFRGANG